MRVLSWRVCCVRPSERLTPSLFSLSCSPSSSPWPLLARPSLSISRHRWDDWVPPDRLLKFDAQGLAKQKQLIENFKQEKKKKDDAAKAVKEASNAVASGSGTKKAGAGAGAQGRKRAREGDGEVEFLRRPEIKFPVPDVLKVQLVDDWEYVTKNQQVRSSYF